MSDTTKRWPDDNQGDPLIDGYPASFYDGGPGLALDRPGPPGALSRPCQTAAARRSRSRHRAGESG